MIDDCSERMLLSIYLIKVKNNNNNNNNDDDDDDDDSNI